MIPQGQGALAGVTVLDLSRVLAGPWATQLLADFGADVIKIERPETGDDTRSWGPPFVSSTDGRHRESAYFLAANRGKRSVCLDFSQPDGRAAVLALARQADVLVENFLPGSLARYGLDYDSLRPINPGLVYCSITGFGQDGPLAQRPGYDFVIQGMGGLMGVTGSPYGEPMKAGVAVVDIMTGLYAANAIQAALRHRDRSGEGQQVDIALLDVQVATLANQGLAYLATREAPTRRGNVHPSIAPYELFTTANGALTVAVGNDRQFVKLCEVLGLANLATDPKFAGNAGRVVNQRELATLLQAPFLNGSTETWTGKLADAGVPAGPVNDLDAVFADPQVRHRGLELRTTHRTLGEAPGLACPVKFSATPVNSARGAPPLGADTDEILQGLAARPQPRDDLRTPHGP